MQPKLLVIRPLLPLVEVLIIVGLILFGEVLTLTIAAAASSATATEMKDMELEDKEIKQELAPSETEEEFKDGDEEDDNTAKQEEGGKEEEQESNDDDTAETGLEEANIMIDNNYSSYVDNVPLELPFDNPMPFP